MARRRILLLAVVPLAVAGCFGGGRGRIFTVSLLNDTPNDVVVRDCSGFCASSPIRLELAPGASADVHRIPMDHKVFSITTATGGHVGCVDLYFATAQPDATVDVSTARPCGRGSRVPWKMVVLVLLAVLGGTAIVRARSRRPR